MLTRRRPPFSRPERGDTFFFSKEEEGSFIELRWRETFPSFFPRCRNTLLFFSAPPAEEAHRTLVSSFFLAPGMPGSAQDLVSWRQHPFSFSLGGSSSWVERGETPPLSLFFSFYRGTLREENGGKLFSSCFQRNSSIWERKGESSSSFPP